MPRTPKYVRLLTSLGPGAQGAQCRTDADDGLGAGRMLTTEPLDEARVGDPGCSLAQIRVGKAGGSCVRVYFRAT